VHGPPRISRSGSLAVVTAAQASVTVVFRRGSTGFTGPVVCPIYNKRSQVSRVQPDNERTWNETWDVPANVDPL
jgi:hypothetical protein